MSGNIKNKYECKKCETSYKTKFQYSQHLKTQKHKKNSGDIFECKRCNKKFVKKYNYERHLLLIHTDKNISNNDPENDQIVDKKSDIDILDKFKNDKNLSEYDKDLEMLKTVFELKHKVQQCEYEKKLLVETYEKKMCQQKVESLKKTIVDLKKDKVFNQGVIKTAVNGLTYARKYYTTAPELKKLDNYDELGEEDKLIELLLFYSKQGKLEVYLGDFLVKIYKKTDPTNQSLWSTDLSRLTFIVRQLLKKKMDWRYDKKGIKVSNTIITPLLDNIKTILKKYSDRLNDQITGKKTIKSQDSEDGYCSESEDDRDKELDNNERMKLVDNQQVAVQIITTIDNKTLSRNIVKYISSHLSLTTGNE